MVLNANYQVSSYDDISWFGKMKALRFCEAPSQQLYSFENFTSRHLSLVQYYRPFPSFQFDLQCDYRF